MNLFGFGREGTVGIEDKRSAIIRSVVSVVADHGFHGASIAAIASHAGVAAGTVYLHFESKNHLIQEAFKKLARHFLATVLKNYPSDGPIRQRFSHLAHGLIRHCMLFPSEFLYLDQFLSSPYGRSIVPREVNVAAADEILQLLHDGIRKKIFQDLPLVMLIALAFGTLNQVMRAEIAGEIALDPVSINQAIEACWRTICREEGLYERGNCR